MCLGFWVGVFFYFILQPPIVLNDFIILSTNMKDGLEAFACGCLSSGTSYILAMIVGDGGIQHEHKSSSKFLGKRI